VMSVMVLQVDRPGEWSRNGSVVLSGGFRYGRRFA
jgi:hypothetical protein